MPISLEIANILNRCAVVYHHPFIRNGSVVVELLKPIRRDPTRLSSSAAGATNVRKRHSIDTLKRVSVGLDGAGSTNNEGCNSLCGFHCITTYFTEQLFLR